MADNRSSLEIKIAELESQLRQVNAGGLGRIRDLAAFSEGSCTNNCTAACTIGCTQGCTGSCVTQPIEEVASQPAINVDLAKGVAGAEMFRKLSGG